MFRLLLSCLALTGLGLTGNAQTDYATLLSGHQEVPSTTTQAEGLIDMTLRGDSLDIGGEITNLSSPVDFALAGGAHIHSGYIGQNGPVLLPIRITQDADFNAEIVDTTYFVGDIPNFETLLDNGSAYVNVHTLDWAGGEVRGQIVNITDDLVSEVFDAMMYGDQQNSPVLSDGIGAIMALIDENGMMTISGSFEIESELLPIGGTGVHLHIGYHGQNGPVALALTPTMDATGRNGVFEASNNTFSLAGGLDTLVQAMRDRRVYINVHSENNPAGELRGQMVSFNNNLYFSYVSYSNPTPFPIAQSVMRVMAEKVAGEDSISVSGSYSGWNANLLAIPLVPFVEILFPTTGAPGLTYFPVNDVRSPTGTSGVLPVDTRFATADAQRGLKDRLRARAGWVTSTGSAVPFDSEFYHECKRAFFSSMTGSQAVPATNSGASGDIITEYYTSRIESTGVIFGLSGPIDVNIAGGMHIHSGFAGESGSIEEEVTFQALSNVDIIAPWENVKFLTPVQATGMRFGGLYYNIHTEDYPTGEVRGQILPRSNVLLHGIMAAGQAVPGNGLSLANGAVMGELYEDKVVFSGSFNDIGGFDPNIAGGSHIHGNTAGATGDIIASLSSGGSVGATDGVFFRQNNILPVTNALIDSFILRFAYANIHSQAVPSGELRGQIGPLANNVTHTVLNPDVTVPYTGMQGLSTGTGHLHGEVYGTNLVVSGSMSDLSSAIDTSIAGGAHLHGATVAQTGGIVTPLQLLLDSAKTSAVLNPVLNNFTLSSAEIAQLLDGDIYANVHTLDAGSGAIRGQMLMSENQYPEASPLFRFPSDGMMVDLGSADGSTVAAIDWVAGAEFDTEQDFGSFWQLYADTTMMPVFQSQVSDSSGISFTFAQIDTLLMDLGIAEGQVATVYHRAATTDGSLIDYSALSEVTFTRRLTSGLNELPAGAARLVNTLNTNGGALLLDVDGLDAGQLTYQVTGMNGNILAEQQLQHAGISQRYELPSTISQAGMYALTLRDEQGRMSSWMFVVK
ncbi:MAG: CHRD domain-containing protein [Saprospiraceae bacterium]